MVCKGKCDPTTRVITLSLDQSEDEAWWTLFHEILHAMSFEIEELKLTETQVREIETGLKRILKLNKLKI